MRAIRPASETTGRRGARRGTVRLLTAVGLISLLVPAVTACGKDGDDQADGRSSTADASASSSASGDGIKIPDDITDRLKQHGIDIDKWKNGEWKKWDKDDWLREAKDFVNPIIEGLWDPDRMRDAKKPPVDDIDEGQLPDDQGVTDPTPLPVQARKVSTPYHEQVPVAGKLLFDGPEGTMVCSATVVTDPAHPGKSNLVWTAGHCVHAGKDGGWYRNIVFVPSYNDTGLPKSQLQGATQEQVAPYGVWWGDWAQTSDQWIEQGGPTGGAGAPYDFAVLHVTREKGGDGKSLEETVGSALPVDFAAPATTSVKSLAATGYPEAPPYDGQAMYQCAGKPGRLSLEDSAPTMYRVGCTMTGGSSGGGWVGTGSDGKPALVSNTSIGPVTSGWLAGPRLGKEAKGVYDSVSQKYAGQ
jgi:hypothetical protein